MPIVLVGTLDTKGDELGFVRDLLSGQGLKNAGHRRGVGRSTRVCPPTSTAPGSSAEPGTSWDAVRARADRGHAVEEAARGVAAISAHHCAVGLLKGIQSIGGSAGTTIGKSAKRAQPFGLPKVMVSTLASGQTRPYVAGSDLVMVNPVADLCGLNRLTRTALRNAAMALAGMVRLATDSPAAEPAAGPAPWWRRRCSG